LNCRYSTCTWNLLASPSGSSSRASIWRLASPALSSTSKTNNPTVPRALAGVLRWNGSFARPAGTDNLKMRGNSWPVARVGPRAGVTPFYYKGTCETRRIYPQHHGGVWYSCARRSCTFKLGANLPSSPGKPRQKIFELPGNGVGNGVRPRHRKLREITHQPGFVSEAVTAALSELTFRPDEQNKGGYQWLRRSVILKVGTNKAKKQISREIRRLGYSQFVYISIEDADGMIL
jgi:hypothetical protein